MNRAMINGRLTNDATIYDAQDGITAYFTLAVARYGSDEADFVSCMAYGKTAEFVQNNLQKGDKAIVEGRLRVYDTEKDGKKYHNVVVVVNNIEFDESKTDRDARRTVKTPAKKEYNKYSKK